MSSTTMRPVIPLHAVAELTDRAIDAGADQDDSDQHLSAVASSCIPALTRRSFLKGTAILSGSLATGTLLATLAPSRSWAAEMTVFDDREARVLLRLTQVIFPHENMPEAINALAVKGLDTAAAGDDAQTDSAVAIAFREGIVALDEAANGDWLAADADAQLTAVQSITDSELFLTVRGSCITSLYDNDLAYAHFGYEGEAFNKGGYVFRGFDDLAWLPDPPADASPPVQ